MSKPKPTERGTLQATDLVPMSIEDRIWAIMNEHIEQYHNQADS